ncbi:hypothetical protein [Humidisolicoccus flavus]|uniref:hypothetical protein n=1 Tax=Humidisolicoccus flavus TaxID=3111414 RepID=UPI003244DCD4
MTEDSAGSRSADEPVSDRQLSEAIVEHLGYRRSAFPRSGAGDVALASTDAACAAELPRVRAIVDECGAIHVDWTIHSLSEGVDQARQAMSRLHPELSDDALDALRWWFTFHWL